MTNERNASICSDLGKNIARLTSEKEDAIQYNQYTEAERCHYKVTACKDKDTLMYHALQFSKRSQRMKFNTHEQLSEYIFSQYMMFGKYTVQDKSMWETFDFEVASLSDFEKFAKLIYEAASNPHPNLDPYDYEFAAASANYPICKLVEVYSDEEYEEWMESIKEVTKADDNDKLFIALTEM